MWNTSGSLVVVEMENALKIERKRIKNAFAAYVKQYDAEDEKIMLKICHTYRVAEISERIAAGLGLSEYDTDLAWVIGMLHDIGRFEQLRQYGTFVDAESIDHAHFGVELLFRDGLIRDYIDLPEEINIANLSGQRADGDGIDLGDLYVVKCAIWNHSAYRIEEGLDERTLLFCKIIRDADKVDIFKVAYDTPIEVLYPFSKQEIRQSVISPAVMQAYREGHAVLRSLKKTPVDFMTGHIALAFELEFPASRQVVREQGYLQKLLSFQSDNPETRAQFEEMRNQMESYLAKK